MTLDGVYLYYNRQGILLEIVNDQALRMYNANVNNIYVYIESEVEGKLPTDITSVSLANFERSDGESISVSDPATRTVSLIPFNKDRDLKKFKYGVGYEFFKIAIPSTALEKNGLLKVSIRTLNNLGGAFYLGIFCVNIQNSLLQSTVNITKSEYEDILDAISQIHTKFDWTGMNLAVVKGKLSEPSKFLVTDYFGNSISSTTKQYRFFEYDEVGEAYTDADLKSYSVTIDNELISLYNNGKGNYYYDKINTTTKTIYGNKYTLIDTSYNFYFEQKGSKNYLMYKSGNVNGYADVNVATSYVRSLGIYEPKNAVPTTSANYLSVLLFNVDDSRLYVFYYNVTEAKYLAEELIQLAKGTVIKEVSARKYDKYTEFTKYYTDDTSTSIQVPNDISYYSKEVVVELQFDEDSWTTQLDDNIYYELYFSPMKTLQESNRFMCELVRYNEDNGDDATLADTIYKQSDGGVYIISNQRYAGKLFIFEGKVRLETVPTKDYNVLDNKPKINGVELEGDKAPQEIGAVPFNLSTLTTMPTTDRNSTYIYVNNADNGFRASLEDIKNMSTKIISVNSEDEIDYTKLSVGDYVFIKE